MVVLRVPRGSKARHHHAAGCLDWVGLTPLNSNSPTYTRRTPQCATPLRRRRLPFQGATIVDIHTAIMNDQLRLPDDVAASPELWDLLTRILDKDPVRRITLQVSRSVSQSVRWSFPPVTSSACMT